MSVNNRLTGVCVGSGCTVHHEEAVTSDQITAKVRQDGQDALSRHTRRSITVRTG